MAHESRTPTTGGSGIELLDIFEEMEKKRAKTQAAGALIPNLVKESVTFREKLDEQFFNITDQQTAIANRTTGIVNEAFNKMQSNANIPDPIATFLSFFDDDFSNKKQRSIIAQGQFQLETAAHNVRQAAAQREMLLASQQSKVTAAKDFYTFTRQNFLDTATHAEMGFRIKQNITKELVQKVIGTELETLKKWLVNPKIMPTEFAGQEELIRGEIFNKQRQNLSDESIRRSNAAQARAAKKDQVRLQLNEYSDPKDLQADLDAGTLPEPIKPQDAINELARVQLVRFELEAGALAFERGNAEAAEYHRANAAANFDLEDAQNGLQLLAQSKQSTINMGGSLTSKGMPFSAAQLRTVIAKKQAVQTEVDVRNVEIARAISRVDENRTIAINSALRIGGELNPGNPALGIPANVAAAIEATELSANAALSTGTVSGILGAADDWEARVATSKEEVEEFLKAQSDEKKGAMREHMQSSTGEVTSVQFASQYIMADAGSPAWLAGTIYAEAGVALSEELIKTATTVSFAVRQDPQTGRQLIDSDDEASDVITLSKAVKESGFRKKISGAQVTQALSMSLKQLATPTITGPGGTGDPAPPSELNKAYGQLMNIETGMFSTDVKEGNTINRNKFNEKLATIEATLKSEGMIGPDQSLITLLYSTMRDNLMTLRGDFRESTSLASISRAVYAGNVLDDAFVEINAAEDAAAQSIANAQVVVDDRNALVKQLRLLQEVSPVGGAAQKLREAR